MRWLLFLALSAHAQSESSWNVDETTHFEVRHERAGSPLGVDNLVERIYESLHTELWTLVPWMTQRKVSVYLYSDRSHFLQGRFHPPHWSGGLLTEEGGSLVLAVYEPVEETTLAHELTHLYFHSYFDERGAHPPPWLDEGLASMLQGVALTMPDPRDKGAVLPRPVGVKDLMSSRPGQDTPSGWVNLWYQQSASVVRFLKRAHIDGQFPVFCEKLRDGATVEAALREVYGYQDVDAFEKAWLKWRPLKGVGQPIGLEGR